VSNWYTDDCPVCENAVLICDGETEECHCCGYERLYIHSPLSSQRTDEFDGAGLA